MTKADKILRRVIGPEARPEEHTEEDPYRDDLAKVVKSRPVSQPGPGAGGSGSEPPLVLVSSLRVDRKSETDAPAEAAEAVQEAAKETEAPRDDTMAEDDASGFEDFARKVGAEELPDLLEAAAAYASFVEGAPHFSRPQIMRQVAKIDPSVEMSREAGLRSFGQLLRQGLVPARLARAALVFRFGLSDPPEQPPERQCPHDAEHDIDE